jgi:hypothetical protein
MNKMPLRHIFMLLTVVAVAVSAYLGRGIPWAKQEPIYSSLFQVSAIIFGVMGAWIAILYPKTLGEILGRRGEETDQSRRARKLLNAMKWSTGIVAACLLVQLFAPLAKEVELLRRFKELIRATSMAFVALLVMAQLWTLLFSLLPIDRAEEEISRTTESAESRRRRLGGASRHDERVDE